MAKPAKKLQVTGFIGKQPDWNQTDETQKDFIKNKPNKEDALVILAEMGFVEPVMATDNSVFTDSNGVLFTL